MKKAVALFTALTLMLTCCVFASAAGFSDLSGSNWDWARDTVNELAEQGIVKGYSDGTYQPNNSVTRQEAFTLFARIVGVNDDVNKDAVAAAQDMYSGVAAKYNTYATKELCYMLYRGIFKEADLDTYLGESTKNLELKRHEAAVLITKVMGGESEIKNTVVYVFDYTDADEIPNESKGYVDFVKKKGIMQGMEDNKFSPNTSVTRAQVAIMLKKTMDVTSLSHTSGTISNVNSAAKTFALNGKVYTATDRTGINRDGKHVSFDALQDGDEVIVTVDYQGLWAVDAQKGEAQPTQTVTGVFTGSLTDTRGTFVKVYDRAAGTSSLKEYQLSGSVTYTYSGKTATLSGFSQDDLVTLTLTNGLVTAMAGEPKYTNITSAVVEKIVLDPAPALRISHADALYDGKTYEVDNSVYVQKNNKTSSLRYILPGDTVTLKLEYGTIISIDAKSQTSVNEGTIEEITIGNSASSIKLNVDGTIKSYAIVRDTEIVVDNNAATLYDLRLGYVVTVNIESDTVTKISVRSVTQAETLTGTITLVNASLGFINLNVTDAQGNTTSHQVFVKNGASIIGVDGGSRLSLADLRIGDQVLVKGTVNMGAFEATSIVLL